MEKGVSKKRRERSEIKGSKVGEKWERLRRMNGEREKEKKWRGEEGQRDREVVKEVRERD